MPADDKKELVLAQNQYAFIQDETKGLVKVHVGPLTVTPSGNDRSVKFDSAARKFVTTGLLDAIQQNPAAPEGSYIVLENPGEKGTNPTSGTSSVPADLSTGRKVNIPGPVTFALWPGQVATVIEGHQLRSNEYVRARVYNVDEAKKNWPDNTGLPKLDDDLATGQVIIIKGTNVNFFIPPTGVEVLRDPINKSQYVCQAITLERLEYCILLDENGSKRYEIGPSVVFPEATEKFVTKKDNSATSQGETAENPAQNAVKFKAIELNDQMGLYVKVIADYVDEVNHVGYEPNTFIGRPVSQTSTEGAAVDDGKKSKRAVSTSKQLFEYKVGDELFITGKVQRIYYPRPEHAIIEYGSEDGKFKRQRYYGIAVPKGEARYVLNKDTGEVRMELGPKVFLPDPRKEVIVRRVLDRKTVGLWYPDNDEARAYNESLASLTVSSSNYVADMSYNAAMDLQRAVNRGTRGSSSLADSGSVTMAAGETFNRGTKFTQPPSLTLNTKYDGPPTISPWTGYAVQIVDKSGKRKVVKGPATVLLQYDETLEKLSLSTGNPKNTDSLFSAVYLRVDHNKVSDTIEAETKDMVNVKVKVSYRVNFEGDPNKWFSVENYVKFMTDHCRSLVRAKVKHLSIKQLIDDSSSIVRNTILGESDEKTHQRTGRTFDENGMKIYDIEVLRTEITDSTVSSLIQNSQQKAVRDTLELTAKQQEVEIAKLTQELDRNLADMSHTTRLKKLVLDTAFSKEQHVAKLASINDVAVQLARDLETKVAQQKLQSQAATEVLSREKAQDVVELDRMKAETEEFVKRAAAIDPKLAMAIQTLADNNMLESLAEAVTPIAVMEQQSIGHVLGRLFRGTPLEEKLNTILEKKTA